MRNIRNRRDSGQWSVVSGRGSGGRARKAGANPQSQIPNRSRRGVLLLLVLACWRCLP